METRPYQQQAIEATLSEYDKGTRRMMVVAATGVGKTVIVSKLYDALKSRLPGRMLIVAHTDAIVRQNADKARSINPHLKVGVEMAGEHAELDCDIVSASVQTLGRKGTKRIEELPWNEITKVVIDEAHHGVTDGYRRILERSGCLEPNTGKLLLGITATPQRPDGEALSDVFDKVAYVYSLRQAIADGWLVDLCGYRVRTSCSLDEVSTSGGDFTNSELSRTVNTPQRNESVVSAWIKLAGGRQTLAFTCDITHAQVLAESFRQRGVKAEPIWGDDPERERKLEDHRAGKTTVLCNCSLLTEGYDDPSISCVVLAAPTESSVRYSQMVGRSTRLNSGKTESIVIDVVDATSKHSVITLPTLMGLSKDLDLKGASLLKTVEYLEKLKEENPNVDFSKLDAVGGEKTLIEQVDMFQIRFPKEVEENSELLWFAAVDGGYKMKIPAELGKNGWIRIFENAIGKWELVGQINEEDFHGVRPTMEEAFKVADEQIRKRVHKMTLTKILRTAAWHGNPVTKGQKKMLEQLFPWKQFNYSLMNSGDASRVISEKLTRRKS